MPVPKKRLGHSDQGHRRSNWKATLPTISICENCGAAKHAHTLCGSCGTYKGRVIIDLQDELEGRPYDDGHDHDHDPDHSHDHE